MNDSLSILHLIPSLGHTIALELRYQGEVRFGPRYYRAILEGKQLCDRTFGDAVTWSVDGEIIALQEWLTVRESEGPRTRICVLDFGAYSELLGPFVNRGFAVPRSVDARHVTYDAVYLAENKTDRLDLALDDRSAWIRLITRRPD